ncbi:hypothetical protein V6N13_062647 [Hibiscus sabdariffa]
MDSNKFALILVGMAVVLLTAMAPTATAARNEVTPSAITTNTDIRNPFANIFLIYKPVENCKPVGASCSDPSECCSGICLFPINFPIPTSGTCFRKITG